MRKTLAKVRDQGPIDGILGLKENVGDGFGWIVPTGILEIEEDDAAVRTRERVMKTEVPR